MSIALPLLFRLSHGHPAGHQHDHPHLPGPPGPHTVPPGPPHHDPPQDSRIVHTYNLFISLRCLAGNPPPASCPAWPRPFLGWPTSSPVWPCWVCFWPARTHACSWSSGMAGCWSRTTLCWACWLVGGVALPGAVCHGALPLGVLAGGVWANKQPTPTHLPDSFG